MNIKALFDLTGRVAIVTGGSAGIGRVMARALAYAGAHVVLVARRERELARETEQLRKAGFAADYVCCDLTSRDAIADAAVTAKKKTNRIGILVNAAGVNMRDPFMQVTQTTWNQTLALNLAAPFFLTQEVAPSMRLDGWGRIINVASLQSCRAFPNGASYGASKGGIVQLTRAIAEEWSRHGITCNAVAPGFFPTELTAPVFSDPLQADDNAAKTMVGRNGNLEDLYGITIFLASDASAFITGQTIYVDGGFSAR